MDETAALLVAYVDGELDESRRSQVEALLAADPNARETVRVYRETAQLLRAAYGTEAAARPATAVRRQRVSYGWAATALAACVAGFVAGAAWASWPKSPGVEFAAEVAEYHEVFARETRHLVEVPAADMSELTQWLGKRLDRRLEVPDLTSEGLRFAGARMLVVGGRPVAQLMYTRAEGLPMALCVTKLEGGARPIQEERFGAQSAALWQDGGYGYVVVGEAAPGVLRAVARDAAGQLHNG